MSETNAATWMIVEMMGHNKLCGIVTEVVVAGGGFLRVEVPATKDHDRGDLTAFVRLVAPSSVYALTPITAELAQELVKREAYRSHPVAHWELSQIQADQKALPPAEDALGEIDRELSGSAPPVVGAERSEPCRICEIPTRNRDESGPLCDDCVEDLPPGGGS